MFTRKGVTTIVVMLIFALIWNYAVAEERQVWGVATLASYHYDRSSKHNEQNWGLGAEVGAKELCAGCRVIGGQYNNSFYRQTNYLGVAYPIASSGHWHFTVAPVLTTGYTEKTYLGWAVVPTFAYEEKKWGVNIGIVPAVNGDLFTVIGLQVKWRFQ